VPFHPVPYSQQDPKWKDELIGFGEPGDTIGHVGCALTCAAMLLSGHGYHETPKSLNEKLKKAGGFAGAAIHWGNLSQVHPQAVLKSSVACVDSDAPLAQVDASIAAGQPVIVMVDSTPAPGLLTHWVLLHSKQADDYLMLDPWPYPADSRHKALLLPRYSQGRPLRRSIMHVIIYECFAASAEAAGAPRKGGAYARVKMDVVWGLNIRSSIDTSSPANILATVPAGTVLALLEADGASKVGAVNQWVRVRDQEDNEGYAAAWYLEKGLPAAPAAAPGPVAGPAAEAPVPAAPSAERQKLFVAVRSAGAKVFKDPSRKSELVSKEKAGAKLVVVEPSEKALPKIGIAGRWLNVKATNNRRGYIDGGQVKEG
jgi:hypothetical protein